MVIVLDFMHVHNFHWRGNWGKNTVIFGADNSSSMHADNRKNDILILCEVPTYELDDAKITA